MAVQPRVMGVHLDELERCVRGDRLRTMTLVELRDRRYGGEWDWRRNMDRRTHRRLVGAGWLTRSGEYPDVLAESICSRVAEIGCVSDAIDWYIRHALKSIRESRREAHHRRHKRFARQQGDVSYYAYRTRLALENGHGSLWHMRKDRGWS